MIETLTNKNQNNLKQAHEFFSQILENEESEKKKLALKKRQALLAKKKKQQEQNKFLKLVKEESKKEELGPKCVICQEGYGKNPNEGLGFYVYSKLQKIEMGDIEKGYTTVTHFKCIHFSCH